MESATTEVVAWLYVVLWALIIAAVVVFAGVEVYRYRKRQIAKMKEASGGGFAEDEGDGPGDA